MTLQGINAIITGSSQGLGLEIARRFVRDGANVAICARDETKLAVAAEELRELGEGGQRVVACRCDVSSESDANAFVAHAMASLSSVQVLVNNAGVYGPKGPTETVDLAEWRRAIEVNLFGVLLPSRAIIPHFKAQKHGKIINLSGGGATAPLPFISAYAASKAAVVRLTETLSEELREYHIDVNAVAPGALNTRLLDEILQAGPDAVGRAFYEKAVNQKETGGAALELGAGLCAWLASSASDGISGRLISAQWDPWRNLGSRRELLAAGDIYTLRRIVPEDRGQKWE